MYSHYTFTKRDSRHVDCVLDVEMGGTTCDALHTLMPLVLIDGLTQDSVMKITKSIIIYTTQLHTCTHTHTHTHYSSLILRPNVQTRGEGSGEVRTETSGLQGIS